MPTGIGQIPLSDNTGVAKLEAEHGQIKVVYYNDNSHLGALARRSSNWSCARPFWVSKPLCQL